VRARDFGIVGSLSESGVGRLGLGGFDGPADYRGYVVNFVSLGLSYFLGLKGEADC